MENNMYNKNVGNDSSSSSSCNSSSPSSEMNHLTNNNINIIENEEDVTLQNNNANSNINYNNSNVLYRQIKEEHKIWAFNTLLLYDSVMCHTTEWPSLTVQWMPSLNQKSENSTGQTLCIGTHTTENYPNFLLLLEVTLPIGKIEPNDKRFEIRTDYEGFNFGGDNRKFNITARIPHQGEVNRAIFLPQKPVVIASRGAGGNVYIFDSSKFGPDVLKNTTVENAHDYVLKGHTAEGWGMSWNENRIGYISSVADDGLLNIWDINQTPLSHGILNPLYSFSAHKKPAQDVCWMEGEGSQNVLLTVGDDGYLMIWDTREDCRKGAAKSMNLSNLALNTLSINPLKNQIIAAGGCDQEIYICDMRRFGGPVHRMSSHNDAVVRVHWSGFKEGLLASGSSDRFISIWDVERVGMEQTPDDAEDGPPELIFSHGGHTAAVSDFSWNPEKDYEWMIASVSEDNNLQIWQPSKVAFEDIERVEADSDEENEDDDFPVE